jgi:hypothetical protein
MSACDAVDGSSTGTEVPWMWVLLRPPRLVVMMATIRVYRGEPHALLRKNDAHNWMNFRHCRRFAALLTTGLIANVPIVIKKLSGHLGEYWRFEAARGSQFQVFTTQRSRLNCLPYHRSRLSYTGIFYKSLGRPRYFNDEAARLAILGLRDLNVVVAIFFCRDQVNPSTHRNDVAFGKSKGVSCPRIAFVVH